MGFREIRRWRKGYVTIQAEGIFLERFLNICTRRELDVQNIRRLGAERMVAELSLKTFRQIRPVCFRTKTRVRILKRQGMPFLIHRYRKRKLALLGLGLALILLWYTSGHIMGITVFGNQKIPTETVLRHLAQTGVALGNPTGELDPSHIRNKMMQELEELAWIGINVSGSRVYIEVVERLTPEPRVDKNLPCHLVASRDGEVLSIEAREGQTMVSLGSGVREGDILVSGIMDNTATGYRAVHAYGQVFARTTYQAVKEYPLTEIIPVKTGKAKTRYTLRILEREIPIYFGKKEPYSVCEKIEQVKEWRIPIDSLPSLFVVKEQFLEQHQEEITRTVAEVLELARKELTEEVKKDVPKVAEVEDQELSHILTEQGTVQVCLTYICRENIALEVPIDREDTAS